MEILKTANLGLSFLLELCMLAGLGYWGFKTGQGWGVKVLLGIGAPLLAAAVWGVFAAPAARTRLKGFSLALLEIFLLGSGAAALYFAGQNRLAWIYAAALVINRILWVIWEGAAGRV
jgi:hypothetical protein